MTEIPYSTVLDEIVDMVADAFVEKQIHPNYLKIRIMILKDKIINQRSFMKKYGSVEKFIALYRRKNRD